jgi:hypothetical protein
MKMRIIPRWTGWLALISLFAGLTGALAQPTIVSTVPTDGATGVSTTNAVVFTFSEAMDTNATTADFVITNAPFILTATAAWSLGNTVLSCTPNPAFPTSTIIEWIVSGADPMGNQLGGLPFGTFTTGTSSGGGGGTGATNGSGTNVYTTFDVGFGDTYDQISTGQAALDTNAPYLFVASLTLASNRTATSATVELPSASVTNLMEDPFTPGDFNFVAYNTNEAILEALFTSGNYVFTVNASSSNQQVTVDLPSTLAQPPAPHLTDYTAAQSVNAAQPFTLTWDAFAAGTASDYIYVDVSGIFTTSTPGTSNALNGTAISVQIPANTLQPNTSYNAEIDFYHANYVTNKAGNYATAAFRSTSTQFSLITSGGATAGGPVTLTNASWRGGAFSFNVLSDVGQSLIIQFNSKFASGPWQTLLTTNSATGVVQVTDSVNTGNPSVVYRAQLGQ